MEGHCCSSVVSERLSLTNYESWAVEVEHYLVARDLWDVVTKGDHQRYKYTVWRRKNAAALHAILISCSPRFRSLIIKTKSPKIAWDTLAHEWRNRVAEPVYTNNNYQKYEPFFRAVCSGEWNNCKVFLDTHPEAVRLRTPGLSKTRLQVAVTEEQVNIVRKLIGIMTPQELEMVRADGFTALETAIEVGNLEIAKFLVRKNRRLLRIVQQAYGLPVSHAVLTGQKHMIHYLYSATYEDDLISPDEGKRAADLISDCIFFQHYDIALHLLKRSPALAITGDIPWEFPLATLAKSKLFPSGSNLNIWQRRIYNCVHVRDSAKDYVPLEIQDFEDSQKFEQAEYLCKTS